MITKVKLTGIIYLLLLQFALQRNKSIMFEAIKSVRF